MVGASSTGKGNDLRCGAQPRRSGDFEPALEYVLVPAFNHPGAYRQPLRQRPLIIHHMRAIAQIAMRRSHWCVLLRCCPGFDASFQFGDHKFVPVGFEALFLLFAFRDR